jgi:hypothetical protein
MTETPEAVVNEQTMRLGRMLTVVCQYDRSLFEDRPLEYPYAYGPDDFVPMAVRRFERALRKAITEEIPV